MSTWWEVANPFWAAVVGSSLGTLVINFLRDLALEKVRKSNAKDLERFKQDLQLEQATNQQRRAEYEELIDTLYETVSIVTRVRPNLASINSRPANDAVEEMAALEKLSRFFEDRITITDELRESGALQDWYDMKRFIFYDPELQNDTPTEFRYTVQKLWHREDALRKKLRRLAQPKKLTKP